MSMEAPKGFAEIRPPNLYPKADLHSCVQEYRRQIAADLDLGVPEENTNLHVAALRLLLIEDVCQNFVKEGSGEAETKRLLKTDLAPHAIPLGVLSTFHSQFCHAMASERYLNGTQTLWNTIEHGLSTMHGLIKVIPEVHARQTGKEFSAEDVKMLLRSKPAAKMFTDLSNIQGPDAVRIEHTFGMIRKIVKMHEEFSFHIVSFDSGKFDLIDTEGAQVLTPNAQAREAIAQIPRETNEAVHGCLAHFVKIPDTEKTFFQYMHDLFVERLCEQY
jgi:hypothetical protein